MIISTFNGVFFALLAIFILLVVFLGLVCRGRSLNTRRAVVIGFSVIALIGYFHYKQALSLDTEYYEVLSGYGTSFSWLNELPLNLCNIILITTLLAALTMNSSMLSFCFYLSFFGPLAALLMPTGGFSGYSLWLPRVFGFYATHFAALMSGPLLVSAGLYVPQAKDIPRATVTLLVLTSLVFLINLLLRATGLNPIANYCFSIDPEGNLILVILQKYIPIPYVFTLPLLALVIPIEYLAAGICALTRRLSSNHPANIAN